MLLFSYQHCSINSSIMSNTSWPHCEFWMDLLFQIYIFFLSCFGCSQNVIHFQSTLFNRHHWRHAYFNLFVSTDSVTTTAALHSRFCAKWILISISNALSTMTTAHTDLLYQDKYDPMALLTPIFLLYLYISEQPSVVLPTIALYSGFLKCSKYSHFTTMKYIFSIRIAQLSSSRH